MGWGKSFAALAACGLAVVATAVPAGATKTPKPVITAFTSSPTSFEKTGGSATLLATVSNATTCKFLSNKPVTGLPATISCSGGSATASPTFPANTGKKDVVYKITLSASGAKTVKKKIDVTVTTGTPPRPALDTEAVSCSDATDCTAVGEDSVGAVYATETRGTWGPITDIPGVAANEINSVSCWDATDCTAVGTSVNGSVEAVYATETNGTWGPVTAIPFSAGDGAFLWGVSCSDATDCTAVGGDGQTDANPVYVTETSGTWGPITDIPIVNGGGFAGFNSVSCSDATDCTAVGGAVNGGPDANLPYYATETDGTWGPITDIPGAVGGQVATGVSCSDATDCTAVGDAPTGGTPFYATETDGTWASASSVPGLTSLDAANCLNTTNCTAVGGGVVNNVVEPFYVTESDGTWGTATEISGGDGSSLTSVSCSDATDCTAVGSNGDGGGSIYATESNGTWGTATAFAG